MTASRELGLEGIVAKKNSSRYLSGTRSTEWVKVKHDNHQEVVIIGWRPNEHEDLASLVLAIPREGALQYAGRVGTGFSARDRQQIPRELATIARRTSPARGVPREVARDARWVRPVRVGEVSFTEVTEGGSFRHPAWRGWRLDKQVADVQWETAHS